MVQITNLVQGKYLTGVSSVVGDTRRKYEDRAKFIELQTARGLDLFVAIIADGVGSADNGGLAAQLSIDSVINYISGTEETDIPLLITNAIKYANFTVHRDVVTRDVDASTTLTVGVIYKDRFYVGNVGDSRAYWVQESGKVIQLTRDHSYYNLKGGDPNSPQAETLVNVIGIRQEVFADIGIYVKDTEIKQAAKVGAQGLPLKVGDTILLCSDGLIKKDLKGERFVKEEEIVHALQTENQPNAAAVKMTGMAEGRYVDDNVSVITIQYTTPGRIENILTKQKRKSLMQKLAYAGLGVLVLAGITVGVLLANNNRKSEQQLADLRNQPTQTAVYLPPEATPTPTAMSIVDSGKAEALSMGSYERESYKEYAYGGVDNPTWSILDSGLPGERMVPGTILDANLKIDTYREVGAMLALGSKSIGGQSLGNNSLYVYGDSSLTLKNDQGITDITLTQGAIYLNQTGRSEIAKVNLPAHGEAVAELIGGAMLLELKTDTVTLWCLRQECSLEYGDQYVRFSAPEVRVYQVDEARLLDREHIIPPGDRYSEYIHWNQKCNGCLPFENINTPTPTYKLFSETTTKTSTTQPPTWTHTITSSPTITNSPTHIPTNTLTVTPSATLPPPPSDTLPPPPSDTPVTPSPSSEGD